MFKKRSQAAMEFLLTYGWAILVVLVVIGALAYFGVLNPSKLLPDKCLFGPGIGRCDDSTVLYSETPVTFGPLSINNIIWIYTTNGFGQSLGAAEITSTGSAGTCEGRTIIKVLGEDVGGKLIRGEGIILPPDPNADIIPLCNIEEANTPDASCETWAAGEKASIILFNCDGISQGERINQEITLTYAYPGGGLPHTIEGSISSKVINNPYSP